MNSEIFEMYRRPQALTLPELVSLGMFITSEPRIGGKRPGGPSELEIGYLERGSVEWWDGKDLEEETLERLHMALKEHEAEAKRLETELAAVLNKDAKDSSGDPPAPPPPPPSEPAASA